MTSEVASPRGSDYALLSRQVRQAGLLNRRPRYYTWKIALTATAVVLGWAAFAVVGNSWWQLAIAVFLAAAFAQLGFLGHDAGHSQRAAISGPGSATAGGPVSTDGIMPTRTLKAPTRTSCSAWWHFLPLRPGRGGGCSD
jgi:hypothetical protein